MTYSHINIDVARKHLRESISWGFVKVIDESIGRKNYAVTEKGREWLRIYSSLLALEPAAA
jgi:predicted transcriptional regulator